MDDAALRDLLARTRRIALVGASANPARPSYEVMRFLLARGYTVMPVNPGLAGQTLLGQRVAVDLEAAARDPAGPLDMVDVFRASDQAGAVVDEAIRLGARSVWLQIGVIDAAALHRAREAGLAAVMDRCPAIEWRRLRPDLAAGGSRQG